MLWLKFALIKLNTIFTGNDLIRQHFSNQLGKSNTIRLVKILVGNNSRLKVDDCQPNTRPSKNVTHEAQWTLKMRGPYRVWASVYAIQAPRFERCVKIKIPTCAERIHPPQTLNSLRKIYTVKLFWCRHTLCLFALWRMLQIAQPHLAWVF